MSINEISAIFLGLSCKVQENFLFLQRCLKMKSKNMRANSMKRKSLKVWLLIVVLTICGTTCFASCSSNEDNGKVSEIIERDTILFGTTGDYRPLSFCEPDGTYWGFDIDVAKEIAKRLGVTPKFIKTTWPTLTADVITEPQLFDLAIGGITITDARRETMLMSEGYLANGKTILCRASEAERYTSLADIDKTEVIVMVNPFELEAYRHMNNLDYLVSGEATEWRKFAKMSIQERIKLYEHKTPGLGINL
jgi:hypothetical protein